MVLINSALDTLINYNYNYHHPLITIILHYEMSGTVGAARAHEHYNAVWVTPAPATGYLATLDLGPKPKRRSHLRPIGGGQYWWMIVKNPTARLRLVTMEASFYSFSMIVNCRFSNTFAQCWPVIGPNNQPVVGEFSHTWDNDKNDWKLSKRLATWLENRRFVELPAGDGP